jgi:glutathione S-transferase
VLQYIADRYPEAGLAPRDGFARSRLQQWLSFVATELHKALFTPLFDKGLSENAKAKLLENGGKRLGYLDRHLKGREFLLDRFTVADAYLFTVLNWNIATPVDLKAWPAVNDYYTRLKSRPSIARALKEEFALYAEEQKRVSSAVPRTPACSQRLEISFSQGGEWNALMSKYVGIIPLSGDLGPAEQSISIGPRREHPSAVP